jgi:hypothetical protein
MSALSLADANARSDPRIAELLRALSGGAVDHGARVVTSAMEAGELDDVARLAVIFADGVRPIVGADGSVRTAYPEGISPGLSAAKARHDLRQVEWLQARGDGSAARDGPIRMLRRALAAFDDLADDARLPWTSEAGRLALEAMAHVHRVRRSPRLSRALSGSWDAAATTNAYRHSPRGIVVIDDFLAPGALAELRRFCLESTVWVGNRYPDGRLSALLLNGFASPLLLQIASELASALPAVIGAHPLRQLWGFKYTQALPAGSTVHADFAAINVNFWITPEDANCDPGTGGMTIYELEAPASWDFAAYNRDIGAIRSLLALAGPRKVHVPYRSNRAVIFNSDLFHETDAVRFADRYQSHRINVTMLYGDRADAPAPNMSAGKPNPSWRSGAFRRR